MFEVIHHAHVALGGVNAASNHALHVHTAKLNLVAGNTEVYNSYAGGGGNEGGYYGHTDGHVTPWSPDYTTRPIGPAGLISEGDFACDNDGFGCAMYNRQAFDDILKDGLNIAPGLDDEGLGGIVTSGSALPNSQTYKIYTDFGTGNEIKHVSKAVQPSFPIIYGSGPAVGAVNPPGRVAAAKAAPNKGACPKWADCTGTGSFHVDA